MTQRQCAECGDTHTWESGRFSKTQWMKASTLSRCKTCVSRSEGVGGSTGDGCGGFNTIRGNRTGRYATLADDGTFNAKRESRTPFERGAFKEVYMGVYTSGSRRGEQCVFKKFLPRVAHRADYFDKDVKAAQKAAELVESWNQRRLCTLKVRINVPEVWVETHLSGATTKWLVEPYVHNWKKFNSNTGWCRVETATDAWMQTLSHFSYDVSGGSFLLCDLQGGVYKDGVILSDPIIISSTAETYGGGDLGPKGVSTFFSGHRCNSDCQGWRAPCDRGRYFEPKTGSSLLGNTGIPDAKYLHSLTPFDEEEESSNSDYSERGCSRDLENPYSGYSASAYSSYGSNGSY